MRVDSQLASLIGVGSSEWLGDWLFIHVVNGCEVQLGSDLLEYESNWVFTYIAPRLGPGSAPSIFAAEALKLRSTALLVRGR